VVPDTKSKVLGEQPVDLDTKIESTTPETDETNEGMVIDAASIPTVTSTLEPESPKQSISSDDFFQELDEERKLADSVQKYYSTLKIERDPHIFKDRPFKPKNKKHNLNTDSMIVETGSNQSVKDNSMGNLMEQNLLTMKQFRAPFVLGLWTACLLLIFGSFATALIAITTFITIFVYFGDMLSNTSTELTRTISAVWSTISLIVSDFYSFISNYKNHFLTQRDPTSTVHKVSGPKKLAKTDVLYDKQEGIVRHEPDISHAMESTTYNYKIPLRIENQSEVLCEIDSDSHLNLITEWYFRKIHRNCKVEFFKRRTRRIFWHGIVPHIGLSTSHA
jgi:hypothetical protein